MELKIDPEFQALIRPLTKEEYDRLEASLQLEKCRDRIITWDGLILDGHNRYEICQKLEIPFGTIDKSFESREAAKDWIDNNQLSRRNLNPEEASLILGRIYNRVKGNREENLRQNAPKDQNDISVNQADRLSKQHGVSAATIKRHGQLADAVEILKPSIPDIEERVMTGDIPSKQAVIKAAKDPEKAVEILATPAKKTKPEKVEHGNGTAKEGKKVKKKLELYFDADSKAEYYVQIVIELLKFIEDGDPTREKELERLERWIQTHKEVAP